MENAGKEGRGFFPGMDRCIRGRAVSGRTPKTKSLK